MFVFVFAESESTNQLDAAMSSKEPTLTSSVSELKIRANDCFRSGDYDQAFELFSAAIAEEKRSPALFSNRSATAMKLKKFPQALSDAEKSVKVCRGP